MLNSAQLLCVKGPTLNGFICLEAAPNLRTHLLCLAQRLALARTVPGFPRQAPKLASLIWGTIFGRQGRKFAFSCASAPQTRGPNLGPQPPSTLPESVRVSDRVYWEIQYTCPRTRLTGLVISQYRAPAGLLIHLQALSVIEEECLEQLRHIKVDVRARRSSQCPSFAATSRLYLSARSLPSDFKPEVSQ